MSLSSLSDPRWRDQMKTAGKSHTQIFAQTLISEGFNGLLVRSFARGVTDDDITLVLWKWSDISPLKITLIDDERRLGRI